jgi:hypothetical protein
VGFFFGRRETLNEQLIREAGLGPERELRRPLPGLFVFRRVSRWRVEREQRTLSKYVGERGYLSEQEAAQGREEFRLRAPDTPPPGFG